MIGYIKGQLREVIGNSCIVETAGGVGYELSLPSQTAAALPLPGNEVEFYTFLAVREDALELYGFTTYSEKKAFELLIGISRIGCKMALAILSIHTPEDLSRIVAEENIHALAQVPGIGGKTAQHVLLELKYKFKNLPTATGGVESVKAPSILADVQAGLANLGYVEEEYKEIARQILASEPDLDVGSALRAVLKALNSRRN